MSEFRLDDGLVDDDNETLTQLERLAESGSQILLSTASKAERRMPEDAAEHHRLYHLIEQLAAPVRLALTADDSPPQLADYGSLEEIGRGGMGIVYRGLHRNLDRLDAIKVIRPDRLRSNDPEFVRQMQSRFERELRLAAHIAHENIVPVYQVGEAEGRLWFSMQLVEGVSFQDLSGSPSARASKTRRLPDSERAPEKPVDFSVGAVIASDSGGKAFSSRCRLAAEQIVSILERISRAVDSLHRHGVIHGDIKPHNILVEQNTGRPLLTDFGLAEFDQHFLRSKSQARRDGVPGSIAGTPAYMAPELLDAAMSSADTPDATFVRSVSADIYSLGATLWATLTGRSPLEIRDSPEKIHFGSFSLPPELLRICQKSMSINPALRYSSAREFADELAKWLNGPRWNRHFPGLRKLLWMIVAPWMMLSNVAVWFLSRENAAELWIFSVMLSNYVPLFVAFFISQKTNLESHPARRELWSIWIGHAVGAVSGLAGLRILLGPDSASILPAFYCLWATVSAVVLFAKSGNFWTAYRWIGICWSINAVAITLMPGICPILFGCFAAMTCIVIAQGDKAFEANH